MTRTYLDGEPPLPKPAPAPRPFEPRHVARLKVGDEIRDPTYGDMTITDLTRRLSEEVVEFWAKSAAGERFRFRLTYDYVIDVYQR